MSDDNETVTVNKYQLKLLQREAAINNRSFIRHLMSVAKFLGVGALVHAFLLGPRFDPNDMWSWGYLLAWPFPLIGWLFLNVGIWILYGFGALIVLGMLGMFGAWLHDRNQARKRAAWKSAQRRPQL